jgi:hypothetical protein
LEQHEEPKPQQRIMSITRGIAQRTSPRDPAKLDPRGGREPSRSTGGGKESEESAIAEDGRSRDETSTCTTITPEGQEHRQPREARDGVETPTSREDDVAQGSMRKEV